MASKSKTNIRLTEASDRYIERIRNEGQSERTVYTAQHALSRFLKAVATKREPNPWVHLITAEDMDTYCYGPEGIRRNIKAISFNRYRSVLLMFFEYALQMRWTDVSPMQGIGRARPDAPVNRLMLNGGELISLLEYTNNPIERIGCSLGMNTGMRANDIRHLTVFDAQLTTGELQTEIRKTRKLDTKPITMELHWELKRWFAEYARLMGLDSPAQLESDWLLMPAYDNRPKWAGNTDIIIRPKDVLTHPWRLVQRPLGRMDYPTKGEGFHTLRRSSARALFEMLRESGEGRDHALMIVKEFLNHSSVVQTEQYLGLHQERAIRDSLLKGRSFLTTRITAEQARLEGIA